MADYTINTVTGTVTFHTNAYGQIEFSKKAFEHTQAGELLDGDFAYHEYQTHTLTGFYQGGVVSIEDLQKALVENATPFGGDLNGVTFAGPGYVVHDQVGPNAITNITVEHKHAFGPGAVERETIVSETGEYVIQTTGVGTGLAPRWNSSKKLVDMVWGAPDTKIIEDVTPENWGKITGTLGPSVAVGTVSSARFPGQQGTVVYGHDTNALDILAETNPYTRPSDSPYTAGSAHWDAYGPGLKDYGTAPSDIPYDGQAFDVHTSLVAPHPTGPIHQPPVPGLHPTDLIVAPTWWNKPVVAQPSLTPEQVAAIERQEAIDDFRSKYGEHHGFKTASQLDKFYDAYGEFVGPGQIIVRDLVTGQWEIIRDPSYEGNGGRPSAANDIQNGEYGGANGDPNVSGGSDSQPILLDLNGNGVEITNITESTVFMAGKDGLDHKIAWAAAGDGVLFYDPDNSGEITELRQFVFTEWDPTAGSDIEALANVFDSNGDGVFDANDAEWANFKVMVTNAGPSRNACPAISCARTWR